LVSPQSFSGSVKKITHEYISIRLELESKFKHENTNYTIGLIIEEFG